MTFHGLLLLGLAMQGTAAVVNAENVTNVEILSATIRDQKIGGGQRHSANEWRAVRCDHDRLSGSCAGPGIPRKGSGSADHRAQGRLFGSRSKVSLCRHDVRRQPGHEYTRWH